MQQDWHGLDGEHPASRMEELVPLLRRLWKLHEGPIEHEGRFYRLDVKPTARRGPPLREEIPVFMAGVNRRMIEAAGKVADGLVGHPLFTPEYVSEVARPALDGTPIAGYITTSVSGDRDQARRDAAAIIAFNSTVKTYRAVHRVSGFEAQAEAVREAWGRGDFEGMAAAVSDEMIDTIALAGTPDEVRARFEERWDGVYERPLLWPPASPRRRGSERGPRGVQVVGAGVRPMTFSRRSRHFIAKARVSSMPAQRLDALLLRPAGLEPRRRRGRHSTSVRWMAS